MKLLLCVQSIHHLQPTLQHHSAVLSPHPTLKYLHTTKILQHSVHVLETGYGIQQTTYKLCKVLQLQRYHLALKLAFGSSYNPATGIGTVLNIVNEKPGDFGTSVQDEWKDLYDLHWLSRDDEPHFRGGFINLTNAYMNVFLPFKKVVGLTVNHLADTNRYLLKKEKYLAECETADGLGFAYTCLYEKQSYYSLCIVHRNLATGEENIDIAQQKLTDTLTDLLKKL